MNKHISTTMSPAPALLYCSGLFSLLVLLPHIQSCELGTARDCAEADFAPGSDLAGEGFDITKMQRKGSFVINMQIWKKKDKSCTLCKNPYLEGKKQKLPISVLDWRPSQKCSIKVSSSIYQSSESLVSASTSSIENDWKANLGINVKRGEGSLMLAGSNSKLAEYSMEKTKKDRFSFTSHSISCGYYSYRVSDKPVIHPEFKRALSQLPKQYGPRFKPRFFKFIDSFGTHYITKVTLGGKVHSVTSIRQCQASLQGLSMEEVKKCLDVEASASVAGKVNVNVDSKHCDEAKTKTESKNSFSSNFNDRITEITGGHTTEPELLFSADKDPGAYKEWLSSIPLHPDVISYSLQPLHELLPTNNPTRKHLRKALHDFILEKSLWRNCSEPCSTGVKSNPQEPCLCSCRNNPGVTADCCPSKRGIARAKVTVLRASGLWGDHTTATDGYVKVHDKNNMQIGRTPVIYNDNNPTWAMTFDLGDVPLNSFDPLKLEVWDEDSKWDDDLLGACDVHLKAGLYENFCNLNHGVLYYKTEVICPPSLTGPSCSDYVGSPMNFNLEKVYVSRHSRPVPQDMLQEMGVTPDEAPLTFKQMGYDPNKSVVQLQ
ncbi:perforin-1-like [Tachysurus fulvidraco]|uniref:perforin-1-like n=1 Tax=Tachysurus fulvidraco TaxID=1234273 RepID=UPI000F4E48F9|nr:perforin-1-like [Tachysurus fulvidraco]XP_027034404.1 perforin-1-like [Tachysurus fulvidraco]